MAAENTRTNWISGGRLPAKSTPAARKISLTGHHGKIRASGGDHCGCARAARRRLDIDLRRDAEPRKKIGPKPDAARTLGDRDGFGAEYCSFEALDGAHVRLRSPRPHRDTEGYSRKINVRFRR